MKKYYLICLICFLFTLTTHTQSIDSVEPPETSPITEEPSPTPPSDNEKDEDKGAENITSEGTPTETTTDDPSLDQNLVEPHTKEMLEEIRVRNGIDSCPEIKEKVTLEKKEALPPPTQKEVQRAVETPKVKKVGFLDKGRRYYDAGFNLGLMPSNSYFRVTDFLKEDVVLDFTQMSKSIPKSGFAVSVLGDLDLFFNLYIKNIHIGFFTNVNAYTFINMPKSLIDLVGQGNDNGKPIEGKFSTLTYAFASTGMTYGMKIKRLSFDVDGSYYVPAVYANADFGKYKFVSDPVTGETKLEGSVDLKVYQAMQFYPASPNGFSPEAINKVFKNGGFDINFKGIYNFAPYADLYFSLLHIPIVPAKLNNGVHLKYKGKFAAPDINKFIEGKIKGDSSVRLEPETVFEHEENIIDDAKRIFRPIKLAVSSSIYPFKNKYLILTPMLGCHCMSPFYIDTGLKIESQFLKVFTTYYSLSREDRIWKNTLGFSFDVRLFRFNLSFANASPSFTGSFKDTGAQINLGFVVGL